MAGLVFITGSSSGLGKALAEGFLRNGAIVYGISRSQTIQHKNYQHLHIDLSNPEEYRSFTFPSFEGFEKVILINNAGSVQPIGRIGKLDMDDAISTYHINILSSMFLIDLLIRKANSSKAQHYVLNISSGAAKYPVEGWGTYCSSKSALDAFAAVANKELANSQSNVSIRNIYPGIVDTAMQEHIRDSKPEDFPEVDRFIEYKNEKKLTSPEEVASAIMRNFISYFSSEGVVTRFK